MKWGENTKRKVGLWLLGECRQLTVDLLRGAGLVDIALHFLCSSFLRGGKGEMARRENSLWNSNFVNGHTPVLSNSANWASANQPMGPTSLIIPPLTFLLWDIHHPHSTLWLKGKLETLKTVTFCFSPLYLQVWLKLHLKWRFPS